MTQLHPVRNDRIMMVTTNTIDRIPFFHNQQNAQKAIEYLYNTQKLHPFTLYGFVIMPDHCHFLINVTAPDTISHVMNCYKSIIQFNLDVPKLWQRRFYITIAPNPLIQLHYIHQNPVKAGLCDMAEQYLWSSASGRWNVTPLK